MMGAFRRLVRHRSQQKKSTHRVRRRAFFECLESRRLLDGAAPFAFGDSYVTREDESLTVYASGIVTNDRDPEGDALKAVLVSGPKNGRLSLMSDGKFVYTPKANISGQDTFTYRASDGTSLSNVATVFLDVAAVNDPPVANKDAYSTKEDVALKIASPGVLRNDTDVDSQTRTAILKASPEHGSLTLNTSGSFTYTPGLNFNGTDSFTYVASDGVAESLPATVSISVSPVNDAPLAADDAFTTLENQSLVIARPGVLGNDLDVDGNSLRARIVTRPSHGTIALNADGSFGYTPTTGYYGTDVFTYRAYDGLLRSGTATVTLTVVPVNQAPVAVNDSYTSSEDTVLTVSGPGLLGNDTDADGGVLSTILAAGPSNGSLTLQPDGSFSYVPNLNWSGVDSFSYQVSDGEAVSNVATVTVAVSAVNDAPAVLGDFYETTAGSVLNVPPPGVVGNDSDVDGDTLLAVLEAGPVHGSLTLNADGSFVYSAAADWSGDDSFTYHVSDGTLQSAETFVVVRVGAAAAPVAPVAANDSYTVAAGQTLNVTAPGVLANDSDANGYALNADLVSAPSHGTLTMNANGAFTYVPAAGYTGTDSFTYRASDGKSLSNVAAVDILVTPLNVIHITPAWLAAQGAAPYILSQANTTYVLQTDVTVDGSAFVVGAKNVTLDLNGNRITYGNSTPITVINGGFETGAVGANYQSGVDGWEMAAAPNAAIAANTYYLWGSNVLQFTNISTKETIVSNAIDIPVANREYAATVTAKGPYGATVTLSVIDAVTQTVLGSANSPNVERAMAAVVMFTPTTTNSVQLKIEVTPVAGKSQSVALDYASLSASRDYGVLATYNWYDNLPAHLRTTAIIKATSALGSTGSNLKITNGRIVQGQGNGYSSAPVHVPSVAGVELSHLDTTSAGINTKAVQAAMSGDLVIHDNTFRSTVDNVTNRMGTDGFQVLLGGSASRFGAVSFENNTLIGSPQGGVRVGFMPTSAGHTLAIRGNVIQSDARIGNPYAIVVDGVHDFEISGNTITAEPGKGSRGILIDQNFSEYRNHDGEVFKNYVDVRSKPDAESGPDHATTALRLRAWSDDGIYNLHVHENTFIARTGAGEAFGAIAGKPSILSNADGADLNILLEDNTFKAIFETNDSNNFGAAVSMEANAKGCGITFRNNVFESNKTSLGIGGHDGTTNDDGTFISNTFVKSSEGVALTYYPLVVGYWTGLERNLRILDPRYGDGISPIQQASDIAWIGSGVKDVSIGWLLNVQTQNISGTALAGANVRLFDHNRQLVFEGTTDAQGKITGIFVITSVFRQLGTNPGEINTETLSNFELQISLADYATLQRSITLTQSVTVTATLENGP